MAASSFSFDAFLAAVSFFELLDPVFCRYCIDLHAACATRATPLVLVRGAAWQRLPHVQHEHALHT